MQQKRRKQEPDDRRHQSPANPAGGGPSAALARRPCPTAPSPPPRHAARPLPAVTLPHPARRTSTRAPRAGAARHAARAPPSWGGGGGRGDRTSRLTGKGSPSRKGFRRRTRCRRHAVLRAGRHLPLPVAPPGARPSSTIAHRHTEVDVFTPSQNDHSAPHVSHPGVPRGDSQHHH